MKDFIPEEYRAKTRSNIIVLAAGIGMYAILIYFGQIFGAMKTIYEILSPFIIGIVLAFLLNVPYKKLVILFEKIFSKNKPRKKLCRVLAVVTCYALFLSLIATFLIIVVPELVRSIRSIFVYLGGFISSNSDKINELLMNIDILAREGENIVVMWENVMSQMMSYTTIILDNVMLIASNIYTIIYQLFVGLIASVYLLLDKDKFSVQAKKLCYALMPRKKCETLIFWARRTNQICSGYITGTIIDSLIIGVLCYFFMSIFKIEYTLLISVLVCVTNVLPFFGPFIGAIPSILILLIINPYSALYFSIMILGLQQLDGNVIKPRILGDSLGISPFWIMASIIIGGGLFGFMGMLLAVPVFALLYAIVRTIIEDRLATKNLQTLSSAYSNAPEVSPYVDLEKEDSSTQDIQNETVDAKQDK